MATIIYKAIGFACLFSAGICYVNHDWWAMGGLIVAAIIFVPGAE